MQRSGEVRQMRYQALNLDEKMWQLESEETKNRTMHRVPINDYVVEIIHKVAKYTQGSKYVFGATKLYFAPKEPLSDLVPYDKASIPKFLRKNLNDLGVENITPHDLRRTGATWITAVGVPKFYSTLMLNHTAVDKDVTGEVYVQYAYDF